MKIFGAACDPAGRAFTRFDAGRETESFARHSQTRAAPAFRAAPH